MYSLGDGDQDVVDRHLQLEGGQGHHDRVKHAEEQQEEGRDEGRGGVLVRPSVGHQDLHEAPQEQHRAELQQDADGLEEHGLAEPASRELPHARAQRRRLLPLGRRALLLSPQDLEVPVDALRVEEGLILQHNIL